MLVLLFLFSRGDCDLVFLLVAVDCRLRHDLRGGRE